MFLKYKTGHGHTMADAYCGLQKSLRCGSVESAVYWSGQIGLDSNGCRGYPNALRKRLCQNSLEDAASWEFVEKILARTGKDSKANFYELLPWVISLAKMSKTHTSAWLQRVAVQKVLENPVRNDKDVVISTETMGELEFSVALMKAIRDGQEAAIKACISCEEDRLWAWQLYKYVNEDPLVYHVYNMHQRRNELRLRKIQIPCAQSGGGGFSGSANMGDGAELRAKIGKRHHCAIPSVSASEQEIAIYLADVARQFDLPVDMNLWSILQQPQELPERWLDKHTSRGKKMGRGYAHFFETMIMAPRVYPVLREEETARTMANSSSRSEDLGSKGGEPYEREAKCYYLTFFIDGVEARARHILALSLSSAAQKVQSKSEISSWSIGSSGKKRSLRTTENEIGVARARVEACAEISETDVSVCPKTLTPGGLRDVDVVELPVGAGGLGFKCATVIGSLKAPLTGLELPVGSSVYMKMGEPPQHCEFALACSTLRLILGMVSVPTTVAWLIPTRDYAALARVSNATWGTGVQARMNKAQSLYASRSEGDPARPAGALPTIVSGLFIGGRLSHYPDALPSDGMELLKILIFRKFVGSADTNASNIMINNEVGDTAYGDVFSVDETIATPNQLRAYLSKGLVTSQSIHTKLLGKVQCALLSRSRDVADFIQLLQGLPLPVVITTCESESESKDRMTETWQQPPFDAASLRVLREGDEESLRKLATLLKIV